MEGTRRAAGVGTGLGAAAGTGLVLVGAAFGWYAYTETRSVLTPSVFAHLRTGTPYEEMPPVLPQREAHDPPTDRALAPPPGTDCRHYRASGELLTSTDHFRLCFDRRDRLVAKEAVPGLHDERREEPRRSSGSCRPTTGPGSARECARSWRAAARARSSRRGGDGREAVELTRAHRPDVVLLDIRMPRLDGLTAAEEIVRTVPGTAVA